PATFVRDDGFDLGGYWREQAEAFLRGMLAERVTVRVSPVGLRRLRFLADTPFAYEEALAAAGAPDGQGWVVTRLPVESVEVAYIQLLGFGPEAEVLDPPELRARLVDAAARSAALYGVAPASPDQR
ncbi:WYL domain-containing protein, partial [Streptomyces sp. NPDC052644]